MRGGAEGLDRGYLLSCLAVFLTAFAVRALFVMQYRSSPVFAIPVIDSSDYDEVARALAFKGALGARAFWHEILYPLLLAGVYRLGGGSIMAARIVQSAAGGITAVLALILGSRALGRGAGLAAGLITALCGPLVFYDCSLLATGTAALLATLSLIAASYMEKRGEGACLVFGLACGLSIAARAVLMPFAFLVIILDIRRSISSRFPASKTAWRQAATLGGIAAVLLPLTILSGRASGHYSPLPRAGAINLYIGNNPDMDRTLLIRPGSEWRDLIRQPILYGYTGGESDYRRYFTDRVKEYAVADPAGFIHGIARKTVWFFSSRELPRNLDIYVARRFSGILSVLVWKWKGFGFPFGLILPLAIVGLIACGRKIPVPVWLFVASYSLTIIAVFPASRYRALILPVLSVPAAAGWMASARAFRGGEWKRAVLYASIAAAVAVAISFPGPFVMERPDYLSELHSCVGYQLSVLGRNSEAEDQLRQALEEDGSDPVVNRLLGCVLHELGRDEEALRYFDRSLISDPDSYLLRYYKAVSLLNLGRREEADRNLRAALKGASLARDRAAVELISDLMEKTGKTGAKR